MFAAFVRVLRTPIIFRLRQSLHMTIVAAYPASPVQTSEIPDFDDYGYLPAGIYDSDIKQVKSRFCHNDHRASQFEKLEKYFARLSIFCVSFSCYLDGSFISDKDEPSDIDLVLEVPDKNSSEFQKISSISSWPSEKWLLMQPWKVRTEFGIHFFHWMPIMQVGGENDQIVNFQDIKASSVIDISARKNITVPKNYKKGIIRIFV